MTMIEHLTPEEALDYAHRCALFRGFPSDPEATTTVADEFLVLCRRQPHGSGISGPTEQAKYILRTLEAEWVVWPSLSTLRHIFERQFIPGDDSEFKQKVQRITSSHRRPSAITRPQEDEGCCPHCHDYGIVARDGGWTWCDCEYAAHLRDMAPDFLSRFPLVAQFHKDPQPKPKKPTEIPPERRRWIEAEIQRAKQSKEPRP